MQEKSFKKTEVKNNICINVFGYKNGLVFPIYFSDPKFGDSMDFLLWLMIIVNGEIEFAPVYFNLVTRTVINHGFRLESSFQ